MKIVLGKIGKKFSAEWIFRGLDFTFENNSANAVLGRNGSGKSTLLQIISGNLHPTEGSVRWFREDKEISVDHVFRHLSIVAPYQELIEEFTLEEMLKFHFSFKNFIPGYSIAKARELLGFKDTGSKPVSLFSSGMKQRLKLVLAFLSDVPLLLLDEPTMNLDRQGIEWYIDLTANLRKGRTLVICSNLEKEETAFCEGKIFIGDFKPSGKNS